MAALATGVIEYMIDGIGFGFSFTFFGALAAVSALLYYVEMKRGMKWRIGSLEANTELVVLSQHNATSSTVGSGK
jgi:hypothetical protein